MRWKAFAIGILLVMFGAACSEDEPTVPIESAAPTASAVSDGDNGAATSPAATDGSPTTTSPDPGGAIYDEKPSDDDKNNP